MQFYGDIVPRFFLCCALYAMAGGSVFAVYGVAVGDADATRIVIGTTSAIGGALACRHWRAYILDPYIPSLLGPPVMKRLRPAGRGRRRRRRRRGRGRRRGISL